jgi:hypothetical protein
MSLLNSLIDYLTPIKTFLFAFVLIFIFSLPNRSKALEKSCTLDLHLQSIVIAQDKSPTLLLVHFNRARPFSFRRENFVKHFFGQLCLHLPRCTSEIITLSLI